MKLIEKRYLLPFLLVTSLFALWGFANDITNPMVAAFQNVMELSASKTALIQFAFYGGYATMDAFRTYLPKGAPLALIGVSALIVSKVVATDE